MTQPLNHRFDPQALRVWREAASLTRTQLAAAAERSERTVRAYEQGDVRPSIEAIRLMAAVLGCDPADLTTPEGGGRSQLLPPSSGSTSGAGGAA